MSGVVQGIARASGGVIPRIAGRLLSVPVTTVFVLLGVAVVLGRGMVVLLGTRRAPGIDEGVGRRRAA